MLGNRKKKFTTGTKNKLNDCPISGPTTPITNSKGCKIIYKKLKKHNTKQKYI